MDGTRITMDEGGVHRENSIPNNNVSNGHLLDSTCELPKPLNRNGFHHEQQLLQDGRLSPVHSSIPSESSTTTSKPQKKVGFLRSITRKQKIILASLAWMHFTNFCALSILAPFFPREAELKGMSPSVSGFVFSCFAIVFTIMSPTWGKLIPFIGIRFIITAGVFVSGTCNVLFGFLDRVENLETFTILCFVVRSMEAMGASAFMTGSFTLVTQVFSKNIGATMGTLETFIGMGLSIGPAIGGFLYELGGYTLPFLSLGICMIVNIPLYLYILPKEEVVANKSGSILALLKNGRIVMILMVIVTLSAQWCFQDPTLEPHLNQFNLSASQVGLFFLLEAAVYAICCPIWGIVSDRMSRKWILMVIGLIGSTFSFLLLGPSPLLPFLPNTIWMNGVSVFLIGVFNAMGLIPTYQTIIDYVTDASSGPEVDLGSFSVVAGVWSAMYSLGEILGPSLGGVLVDNFGFPTTSTVIGFVSTVVATVLTTYFCTRGSCCKTQTRSSSSCECLKESTETTHLLHHHQHQDEDGSTRRAFGLPLWRSKHEI